ncbi:Gamma-soluble NSF attachment protein [Forsythia ovata]|uniref:Gamma-soluble NSF attachment protein n=1 Tax=Forsythia ovata TaxID=205694 RepID=A0ABD1QT81_9LAMI
MRLFLQRKSQLASDALAKGARVLENVAPEESIQLYIDACDALEEDGKEQMAFDLYRVATSVYIKLEKSQLASDALAKGARVLENVAPEEAIQLYIDACDALEEDGKEQMAFDLYRVATSVYIKLEKYADVEAFLNRDQNHDANRLLSAYTEGDVEEIKRATQSSIISNLDHMIIKLARKLPTGDVSAFKMDAKDQQELLDKDDLT